MSAPRRLTSEESGMSAYTDADVQAAGEAFWGAPDGRPGESIRAMLDAVAPAIAARALREAAEDWDANALSGYVHESNWLRARADAIEAGS